MIKKAGEVTNKKKHVFIIQGLPGTGKTTLALSAPNPILIDCDGNSHKVELEHIGELCDFIFGVRVNHGIIRNLRSWCDLVVCSFSMDPHAYIMDNEPHGL